MSTDVNITIESDEVRSVWEQAAAAAFRQFEEIEQRFSLFRPDSELCLLNAAGQPTRVSEQCYEVIRYAIDIARETDWAFNPFTQSDSNISDVAFTEPSSICVPVGGQLDVNSVVKGLAIDMALQQFTDNARVMIEAGGDIAVQGVPAGQQHWNIGIRDPHHPDDMAAILPVQSGAVCTSGMYFRGEHVQNDRRLFNKNIASVTVLAPTATHADAYSTALFFMDIDQAIEFIEAKTDMNCLLIDHNGTLYLNPRFQEIVLTSNNSSSQ